MRVGNISDMIAGWGVHEGVDDQAQADRQDDDHRVLRVEHRERDEAPRRGADRADRVDGLPADAVGEAADQRDHDHVHDVRDDEHAEDLRGVDLERDLQVRDREGDTR
jgi:hypothetical protein